MSEEVKDKATTLDPRFRSKTTMPNKSSHAEHFPKTGRHLADAMVVADKDDLRSYIDELHRGLVNAHCADPVKLSKTAEYLDKVLPYFRGGGEGISFEAGSAEAELGKALIGGDRGLLAAQTSTMLSIYNDSVKLLREKAKETGDKSLICLGPEGKELTEIETPPELAEETEKWIGCRKKEGYHYTLSQDENGKPALKLTKTPGNFAGLTEKVMEGGTSEEAFGILAGALLKGCIKSIFRVAPEGAIDPHQVERFTDLERYYKAKGMDVDSIGQVPEDPEAGGGTPQKGATGETKSDVEREIAEEPEAGGGTPQKEATGETKSDVEREIAEEPIFESQGEAEPEGLFDALREDEGGGERAPEEEEKVAEEAPSAPSQEPKDSTDPASKGNEQESAGLTFFDLETGGIDPGVSKPAIKPESHHKTAEENEHHAKIGSLTQKITGGGEEVADAGKEDAPKTLPGAAKLSGKQKGSQTLGRGAEGREGR